MVSRILGLFISIFLITYNSSLHIPDSLLPMIGFFGGYSFISCITQFCLVNGIWKSSNTNNVDNNEVENNTKEVDVENNTKEIKEECQTAETENGN
jgi:hypothetical protein